MNALFAELEWLPRVPEDFSARLKRAVGSDAPGRELSALARYALDLNQLTKLAKAVRGAREQGKALAPLVPFRLALLSNSTTDFISPALVGSAVRHGIELEVIEPAYGQAAQEAFNPQSKVNTSKPRAVLFALDIRALPVKVAPGDGASVRGAMSYLESLRDGVRSHAQAACIMQTFAPPVETLFGSLDRAVPGTLRWLVDAVNRELVEAVAASGDALVDVAALAETVGLANWHDPRLWNLGKFAFSEELIPLYADHVGRTIAALCGKSKKVLILDLDNTVWGGVIGDDGLEGIQLASGDARGEAHLSVQRYALELRKRGVLLAVSSKNADEAARAPFERHPEMLLKLEHIAAFQANWSDKATNIEAIAKELSLGLDAMVFLDDNPAERSLIRQLLPQVAVPELPDDPAYFVRTLAAAGYFEATTFAAEDAHRADYYRENAKRVELQKQSSDLDGYLESLDMTITFQPFDESGRARIVQLINKTNQYNLTTRRYTEPEVIAAENDAGVFTLQVRLADVFGDNGMISVVICRDGEPYVWEIETWLMSCRVIGRKVEFMVLREILAHARAAGVRKLRGCYRPTGRNQLVEDHYSKLGFGLVGEDDKTTYWTLDVRGAAVASAPMTVISQGFAVPAK